MTLTPDLFLELAIGLALFAFGWTLFRFGIKLIGFGLGFMAGYSSYELLLEWVPKLNPDLMRYIPDHPLTSVFIGVVIGIVGLFLAKRMFMVVVFLGALAGGLYLMYSPDAEGMFRQPLERILQTLGLFTAIDQTLGTLWPAVFALLIAGIFVMLQKHVIILLTAVVGSYIIVEAINIPVLFLPLCFIGYFLQQAQSKHRKKRKKREAEEDED